MPEMARAGKAARRPLGLVLTVAAMVVAGAAAAAVQVPVDNDEVRAEDIRLAPGEAGAPTPADADIVVLYLGTARVRTRMADGTMRIATRRFGDALFVPKGSAAVDSATGAPVHEVRVALKAAIPAPLANASGLPPAFPRAGAIRRLENDRVAVWNYRWRAGHPTPLHFHDKDVVLAYRDDATIRSTARDGQVTDTAIEAGDVRFNKGGRIHSELLAQGRESAVIVELKR